MNKFNLYLRLHARRGVPTTYSNLCSKSLLTSQTCYLMSIPCIYSYEIRGRILLVTPIPFDFKVLWDCIKAVTLPTDLLTWQDSLWIMKKINVNERNSIHLESCCRHIWHGLKGITWKGLWSAIPRGFWNAMLWVTILGAFCLYVCKDRE